MEYLTWKAIKAFLSGIPSWVWLALAIAGSVWFYGHLRYNAGEASQKAETAQVQAKFDAYKKDVEKAVRRQAASNLAKQAADRAAFQQIAARHAQEIKNAKAKSDAVIAGLRAGTIKLRKQWQGCSTPAKAADGSSGVDEDARLREESAGRIIGNAAEADSWIRALQDVIKQLQSEPVQ